MKTTILTCSIALTASLSLADVLADSEADFSSTQGVNGWFYRYYNITDGDFPTDPSSFRQCEEYSTDFAGQWSQAGSDDRVGINDRTMQPHLPGAGRNDPNEYWTTRRWLSFTSGTINLAGLIDEGDLGGDSTDAFVYVDGVQVVAWALTTTINSMIEYDLDVAVSIGSTVDLVVRPKENVLFDGTIFTAIISGDPPCGADLNMDGTLNFFDVSAFLAAYTSGDPIADFTNDGEFNFFDVSAFLSAYNAGCP